MANSGKRTVGGGRLGGDRVAANFADGRRHFEVMDAECVGCDLCVSVCPVEDCITLVQQADGVDPRTGEAINPEYSNWTTHPNNPNRVTEAAE